MAVTEPQKKPFFLHLARQPTFNVETWPFASVVSRTLWSWIRVCAVDPANEPLGGGGTAEASAAASAATTAVTPHPIHRDREPSAIGCPSLIRESTLIEVKPQRQGRRRRGHTSGRTAFAASARPSPRSAARRVGDAAAKASSRASRPAGASGAGTSAALVAAGSGAGSAGGPAAGSPQA